MSLRANIIQEQPNREFTEEKLFLYERQVSGKRFGDIGKRFGGSRRFQLPKGSSSGLMSVSPMRLLKHFAGHVARALSLCMVSGKRTSISTNSGKNSNSLSAAARSKPFVAPLDSHRMEAIEDCIQFINSSCTLSRSNSTAN